MFSLVEKEIILVWMDLVCAPVFNGELTMGRPSAGTPLSGSDMGVGATRMHRGLLRKGRIARISSHSAR